jgi:hypothetical protein
MRAISTALILVAGILNLAPAIGVLSVERLHSLYGVSIEDPNLAILMRHRAVLFAIIGGLLIVSVFHAALRPVALAVGVVSMGSFVVLALLVGDYSSALRRILVVDVAASLGLVLAAILEHRDGLRGF